MYLNKKRWLLLELADDIHSMAHEGLIREKAGRCLLVWSHQIYIQQLCRVSWVRSTNFNLSLKATEKRRYECTLNLQIYVIVYVWAKEIESAT